MTDAMLDAAYDRAIKERDAALAAYESAGEEYRRACRRWERRKKEEDLESTFAAWDVYKAADDALNAAGRRVSRLVLAQASRAEARYEARLSPRSGEDRAHPLG